MGIQSIDHFLNFLTRKTKLTCPRNCKYSCVFVEPLVLTSIIVSSFTTLRVMDPNDLPRKQVKTPNFQDPLRWNFGNFVLCIVHTL